MKNNVNVVSNAKDVSSKVQENDSTVNFKRVASRSNMFNFIKLLNLINQGGWMNGVKCVSEREDVFQRKTFSKSYK